MRYRLLALDIDDTLVDKQKRILPENLAAIRRAQAAGVYVTVITGRGYFGSSPVWKELEIQGLIGNYGGAVIMNTQNDQIAFQTLLDADLVSEILEYAHETKVHIQLYQNDKVIFEKANDFTEQYVGIFHLPHAIEPEIRKIRWENVPKMLVAVEPTKEKQVAQSWMERFGDRLGVHLSMPGYIELNRRGAHKGGALCWIAQQMGISIKETVAIGDNTLDLEMIQAAGLGACVGDGNETVKSVADVITPTCEDGGVAWLIDRYILGA